MTEKHIFCSSLATGTAEILTLPLCTLKTNYQNSNFSSITETTKHIYNVQGIRGFYNASFWAISSQIFSTSTKYTFYQILKENMSNVFLAGTMSGFLASLLTHPLDVLKIHRQMNANFLSELYKNGPRIFYRGYSKTLTKSSLGSTFFFPLYDTFNKYLESAFIASFCSALVSTTLLHPIDYMKTRQIYGQAFFTGFHPLPYFRGLSLSLSRIVPHFVITMTLIDYLEKKF